MTSYCESTAHDARLIILRELTRQVDGRLNAIMIRRLLDAHGIRRPDEWVESQLNRLSELEAITLDRPGGVIIVAITRNGRDHVDERTVIAGVSRPSEIGG